MNQKVKRNLKRVLSCFLAAVLFVTSVPESFFDVLAADPIARMNGKDYTNFNSLYDDLSNMSGSTFTIDMLQDWDASRDGVYNKKIFIRKNKTVTLNMNGHMFNRNLTSGSDYSRSGSLISMGQGSTLIINGGTKEITHSVKVYDTTDTKNDTANKTITVAGGVLTGGSSTFSAGGIILDQSCNLVLNDVTLAGCRAETGFLGVHGDGGGISLYGDGEHTYGNSSLTLNNSSIIGCYAHDDGGAIFSNTTQNKIVLNNSHIDDNYCGRNGAGVYLKYAQNCSIKGVGESTISRNTAKENAGALYIDEEAFSIYNVTMDGNVAGKNGGAIYSNDDTITLSTLTIKHNHAERGGGIYINKQKNTIASCIITENGCSITGDGVYIYSDINDLTVTGATVIKDNGNPKNTNKCNLYMSDADPEDNRVNFALTKGADVHIGYYDTKNKEWIMITPGKKDDAKKNKDYTKFLTADNSGYYIYFESQPNYRKLYLRKGSATPIPDPTKVASSDANDASNKGSTTGNTKAGVVGTVGPGGESGSEYNLIRGFYLHEETDNGTDDHTGMFYYSDALFDSDPAKYNNHLATISWIMAFAGTYLRKFEEADEKGNTYYNKHAGSRQFMADIGCPDQNIYVNDSLISKPTTDSIGVTIASKELEYADGTKTGKILIPVTVRGGGYESEWASNVTLGTKDEVPGGEAAGFAEAANKVTKEIDKYITKYELEDELEAGNVKFWVTGFSRAGATANLTAKRLIEKYANGQSGSSNQVFAYPCEAPKGGTDAAEELAASYYYCIHNLINQGDVVPLVAPTQMGFKRYGVDHYIPGTEAQDEIRVHHDVGKRSGGDGEVPITTYSDNEVLETKSDLYNGFRDGRFSQYNKTIQDHLRSIDSNLVFDDYFHPMAMKFVTTPDMYENGNYADNRVEDFIEDFIRFFQEGLAPDEANDFSQAVSSRKAWAKDKTVINGEEYSTIQQSMRDTMSLVFNMDEEHTTGFIDRASTIMDSMNKFTGEVSKFDVYWNVIRDWHSCSEKDKEKFIKYFWKSLKESGALDYLEPEEVAKLERNWPTVASMLFRFAESDYDYEPGENTDVSKWAHGMNDHMTFVPTFATFSSYILMNHYPEVNIAWTRMSDDWYTDERGDFIEYEITPPSSVSAPIASIMAESETGTVETVLVKSDNDTNKRANIFIGDQRVILENKDIVGEAVYYDLEDITAGEGSATKIAINQLYRGGVDLTLGDSFKKSYKLTTYDMSYGVKSEKVIYYINITNGKHEVTVKDKAAASDIVNQYKAGEEVRISATVGEYLFESWKITNESGTDVTDKIFAGAYAEEKTNEFAKFIMPPDEGDTDFEVDYSLTAEAIYRNRISKITANIEAPVSGQPLDASATISFDTIDGQPFEYPIVWTYNTEAGTVIDSGNAYGGTGYTATINIPEDMANYIAFIGEGLGAEVRPSDSVKKVTVARNSGDGSATLKILYNETDGSGDMRQDAPIKLTIKAFDINLNQEIPESEVSFLVRQEQVVTISPEDVADERFVYWDLGEGGITKPDTEQSSSKIIHITIPKTTAEENQMTIKACYAPVVNGVKVTMDQPKGGYKMPSLTSMVVTVTNDYVIDPSCIETTWNPAPLKDDDGKDIADYDVAYTATFTIKPYTDDEGNPKIKAKVNGTEVEMDASFFYSTNVTATVNGDSAIINKKTDSLSYTFAPTKYRLAEDVENPDDVSGIPHGADWNTVSTYLPSFVKIRLNTGLEMDVAPDWSLEEQPGSDPREESTWVATGRIILPSNVENPDGYSTVITMNLIVNEADHAASPDASLDSGTYLYDQLITLDTDTENGTIWYTTDGSDPTVNGKQYNGETIPISRDDLAEGETDITIRAYTTRDDLWDSNIATFVYEFTNEVPVPGNLEFTYDGESKTGVTSGIFYTLSGTGITFDKEGNAIATNAGTYKVKAKIKDGFTWKIEDGTDEYGLPKYRTTTADQTITFTILPADINDVGTIDVASKKHKSVDELKKDIKISAFDKTLKEGTDYDIQLTASQDGKVTVTVIGKGNYAGTITKTYTLEGEEVEPDHVHEWGEWVVTKEPTTTEEGSETRTCRLCGETETRAIPKLSEDPSYRAIAGDGNVWYKGSTSTCDFRFKRSVNDEETYERFKRIQVDGVEVSSSNYSTSSGSVIINLKPEYLETLSVGSHSLTAVFDDGSAKATFTIKEKQESNDSSDNSKKKSGISTGDETNLTFWWFMLISSMIGIITCIILEQKKRYKKH